MAGAVLCWLPMFRISSFGTPEPTLSTANLGVLSQDEVNIVVHGHEPLLSEMIIAAANDKEILDLAKQKGAKGD